MDRGANPENNDYSRFARCYHFMYYPDEKKYKVVVPFQDKYSCYVPGDSKDPSSPYGAYYQKRKEYSRIINDKMKVIMRKQEERTRQPAKDPRDETRIPSLYPESFQ